MTLSNRDERMYLECHCSSPDHIVRVSTYEWSWRDGEVEHDLYIEVQLSPYLGFFGRLWASLKYIFGRRHCGFGDWASCMVTVEQAKELRDLVERYIVDSERGLEDGQP